MHNNVKKFAESGDLQRLKYVFVDCLDVDPTFEKYEEDYEYAKNVPGLMEQYVELTPFRYDQASWDEDYWVSLKRDLAKNFSDERMEHMKSVVKIVHADKLKRVLDERLSVENSTADNISQMDNASQSQKNEAENGNATMDSSKTGQEMQNEKANNANISNVDNSLYELEKQKEEARISRTVKEIEEHNSEVKAEIERERSLKKAVGIVLAVVLVVVIILVIALGL